MKALTFHGKHNIQHESVKDPIIEQATDVIVRERIAGLCGSDLHVYHERERGLDHGTVMGHEFVGEIVEVGRRVSKLRKGDVVFSPFTTSCGRCFYCRANLTCRCTSGQLFGWRQGGIGLHGGQAEFVRVPLADSTLLKTPDGLGLETALMLGDILSTGYFCADMAQVSPGGTYAVVGCGPVGLCAVLSAIELGAERVYALDTISERLQLAERFGAMPIAVHNENAVALIRSVTDGRGADAVLEVVGNPGATRLAVDLVRPGGIISTVGVHNEAEFAFSPVEAYDKNLTFKIGRCPARYYMERLIPLAQKRAGDLLQIISHRLPLSAGPRAYEIFDQKKENCTKVILMPDSEASLTTKGTKNTKEKQLRRLASDFPLITQLLLPT